MNEKVSLIVIKAKGTSRHPGESHTTAVIPAFAGMTTLASRGRHLILHFHPSYGMRNQTVKLIMNLIPAQDEERPALNA